MGERVRLGGIRVTLKWIYYMWGYNSGMIEPG